MVTVRHRSLILQPECPYAEIIPGPDGAPGEYSCWRAVISLQSAGHMGRDSNERRENRRRLFRGLNLAEERVYGLTQVHSQIVVRLDGTERPGDCARREGDGLVTDRGEPVLSVTAADCLPILLYAPGAGPRALVHSGWRGTGIVSRACEMLYDLYGVTAAALRAVIGPGIGSCCYEVPEERYRDFTRKFGAEAGTIREGRRYLDLRRANLRLLEEAGVKDVTVIDNCTRCEPWLGSFRRDGKDGFHNMLVLFGRF